MKKILLLIFIFSQVVIAQRTCGLEDKMNELQVNDPAMYQLIMQQVEQSNLMHLALEQDPNGNQTLNTIRIPVAVHYPEAASANATLRTCLSNLAQNQIDILNADYNGANIDISNWNFYKPSFYPNINNGSLNVQFVIADQNHPAVSGLSNGQKAITFGYNYGFGSDWDPNWAGYLNIVVKNLGGGTLGYAYLASNPISGAAVFINKFCFGSGAGCTGYQPQSPYNKGRTLTHELGHYFNLQHVWGPTNAPCGNDQVADTPLHSGPNYSCPSVGLTASCSGSPIMLHMNYMDYTDDACMYMFTAGQAVRMQAHYNSVGGNFNNNTLSNADFDYNDVVSVFPNPNKGVFSVKLPEVESKVLVEVFDMMGRQVFSKTDFAVNETSIQFDQAQAGVFQVVISTDLQSAQKRIIIK